MIIHAFVLAAAKAPLTKTHFTSHRSLVLGVGLALGAIIVVLGIPLLLKKVRPNRVYGLVSAVRFESRTKWYAVNRFLGAAVIVAGLITIAATGLLWVVKPAALSKSNKFLALVEFVVVVVPAAAAYAVASLRIRNL